MVQLTLTIETDNNEEWSFSKTKNSTGVDLLEPWKGSILRNWSRNSEAVASSSLDSSDSLPRWCSGSPSGRCSPLLPWWSSCMCGFKILCVKSCHYCWKISWKNIICLGIPFLGLFRVLSITLCSPISSELDLFTSEHLWAFLICLSKSRLYL